jgi:hypothetical protein
MILHEPQTVGLVNRKQGSGRLLELQDRRRPVESNRQFVCSHASTHQDAGEHLAQPRRGIKKLTDARPEMAKIIKTVNGWASGLAGLLPR